MSEFVKFSAAIRHFNEQLAVIAAKHRTLEAQRGEVAALIRNTAVIGSPDVIAGLLDGKKMPANLRADDQDMWIAFELLRLDGLSYDDAIQSVADSFYKSTKTVEAALSKAKKTGRFISPSISDEKNR
jgi:hypothetical protein